MHAHTRHSLALSITAALTALPGVLSAATPPAPFGAVPNARQLKQHGDREFYAFCHFTTNTFTDREWGHGGESETIFNPSAFDPDQVVQAAKSAGMTAFILTCKHHDGFCLWPTKTTAHSVTNSPYKNGKGDVVREFEQACRRAGLEFGIYLSPWDRNHPAYGKPEYVEVYRNQLTELLTGYGPVFEIWLDGANGGSGHYCGKVGPVELTTPLENRGIDRKTYYDWPTTWKLMREHQPDALIFSDVGPDIRWCGNEHGFAPPHIRATITYNPGEIPGQVDIPKLNVGTEHGSSYVPAEVDVSIRPGWFWHAAENSRVRSPENLMGIYLNSVGHGQTLLLNLPPDRRGRLHENDTESLRQLGEHLGKTFSANLADGGSAKASNIRGGDPSFGPDRLLDQNKWSAWITDDSVTTPEVVITLPKPQTFNLVRLREDIRLGLRVEGVSFDAWIDGAWTELAKAETIGANRLWRVPKTTTDKVRLRVTSAPVCPALSDFGLFLEPDFDTWVPPVGGNPKAVAKAKWKVLSCSYQNAQGGSARQAIDGDPKTLWHTHGDDGERPLPQHVAIDLGAEKDLAGFTCLPRQDGTLHGMVDRYEFAVSRDGKEWTNVAAGEFGNLRANPVEQAVSFDPVKARYVKFTAVHAIEKNHAAIAEIGVIEK